MKFVAQVKAGKLFYVNRNFELQKDVYKFDSIHLAEEFFEGFWSNLMADLIDSIEIDDIDAISILSVPDNFK